MTTANKPRPARGDRARTISVVARDAGVNVETVRFYERQGIVKQPKAREGWRVYDDLTVQRIIFVRRAQQLGFSLREVKELLRLERPAAGRCASAMRAAEHKLEEIDAKIADLHRVRRALTTLRKQCAAGGSDLRCPLLESLARPGQAGLRRAARR